MVLNLKSKIKNNVRDFFKYNKCANRIYIVICSFVTFILSILTKRKTDKILFISSGGRKFDCNPRAIYEYMLKDNRFDKCEYVWAFVDPSQFDVPKGKKVKSNTLKFYLELFSSSVWISNTLIGGGIRLRRGKSFYIHTTHGFNIKKEDEYEWNTPPKKKKKNDIDYVCTQGEVSSSVIKRILNVLPENVHVCGYPRNDELFETEEQELMQIKNRIGIPPDKKVILYAPTYREYKRSNTGKVSFMPPISISKWRQVLSNEYVVLFRVHYLVAKYLNIESKDFSYDVSDYEPLADLFKIADMLISDYSGVFMDYSILGRPMFCFAYDYEEYVNNRGLYIDILNELPCDVAYNEDDLLRYIITSDKEKMSQKTSEFNKKYIIDDGNASKRVCDYLYNNVIMGKG